MNAKHWLTILLLIAGIPLAAYGFANRVLLLGLIGLGLVFAFIYRVIDAMRVPDPVIKPAPNSAWAMRDQPVESKAPEQNTVPPA